MSDLGEARKVIKRNGNDVAYMSDHIKIGPSIDMGLEIIEIASPIFNANETGIGPGGAFKEAARQMLKEFGGHQYLIKLFAVANLRRSVGGGDFIAINNDSSFRMAYNGKGGLVEVLRVTEWLLRENFEDFFEEIVGSFGKLFQGTKQAQSQDETLAKEISKNLSQEP